MNVTDCSTYQLSPSNPVAETFLRKLPKNGSILVAGCGDGKINYDLSQEGNNVVGIDCDQTKIEKAKNTFISFQFHVGNLLTLGDRYESGQFKGIWLTDFFGKLSEEDQGKAIGIIKNLLDKKGFFYLSFPAVQKEKVMGLLTDFQVLNQELSYEIKLICVYHG